MSLQEEVSVSQEGFQIEREPEGGGPGYFLWDNEGLAPGCQAQLLQARRSLDFILQARGLGGSEQKEGLNLQVNPGAFSSVLHALPHTGQLAD